MKNGIVFIMAIATAFIIFAAFHAFKLSEIKLIGGVVSFIHFIHLAKAMTKIYKWGFAE